MLIVIVDDSPMAMHNTDLLYDDDGIGEIEKVAQESTDEQDKIGSTNTAAPLRIRSLYPETWLWDFVYFGLVAYTLIHKSH